MKLTAKNLLENWEKVKGQLSERVVKAYEAGVPDAIPYYDDPEFAEIVDMFLHDANEELESAGKKAEPKKLTAEERKRRVNKIKEQRKVRNFKPEMPAECEGMKHYLDLKKKYPERFILIRKGDFYETYGQDAIEVSKITGHVLTKSSKYKTEKGESLSMCAIPHTDIPNSIRCITELGFYVVFDDSSEAKSEGKTEKKSDKTGKSDIDKKESKNETKKDSKKAKTSNKPLKDAYARKPYWYKILEGFCGLAGKTKETWRIQNYLDYIQDACAAERKRNTPFIELIRKIQDGVIKYANADSKEKPKQTLPAWADLVKECKDAMKTVTISTKTGASPFWSKAGLAGISIQKWFVEGVRRGFNNLDAVKKYVKSLDNKAKKLLSDSKAIIYRTTDGVMDRTVCFTIQKDGKVRYCKVKSV